MRTVFVARHTVVILLEPVQTTQAHLFIFTKQFQGQESTFTRLY